MHTIIKEMETSPPPLMELNISTIIFISFLLSLIIFLIKHRSTKTSPPSPPKLPIIGNLHQLSSHPHRSLRSLSLRHGPIMLLHFGSVPVLIISSPNSAREIMKTQDLIFANRPKSRITEKLLYNYRDIASAPYGEYWRQIRSLCVLHLLSTKRVESFRTVREEESDDLMNKIETLCGLEVDLSEMFEIVTNNVISRVALGRKYGGGDGGGGDGRMDFKKVLGEFGELLGKFDIGDYLWWLGWVNRVNGLVGRMEKVAKELDCFLDGVVQEHLDRRSGGGGGGGGGGEEIKDFVDVLLWIQEENEIIDRISIKAVLLDVFAAGTDTTYTVLEWAMTELLRHPESMKKLQNEVRKIGQNNPKITEDDLDKMHYLKAVIKETMRLHPPIPLLISREPTQSVKVMGFEIEKGTQGITSAWAIGRDPETWDNPEEFLPERFLNSRIDFKGHDFELIPFGAGRRGCPGIMFAVSVDELVLANAVYRFDWKLPDSVKDLDVSESTGLTIHRKYPLIAVPTRYSSV